MSEAGLQVEQNNLQRKNEEITISLREKTRKNLQTQELYDKLKRRAMLGQVQDAASDEVDNAIQASAAANHFVDKIGNQNMRPPPPLFSGQQNTGIQRTGATGHVGMGPPQMTGAGDSGWGSFSTRGSINRRNSATRFLRYIPNIALTDNPPMQTPSSHRQNSGSYPMQGVGLGLQTRGISATPQTLHRVSPRLPFANVSGNNQGLSGFTGYGMSAGLKVSNPTGATKPGAARPAMRSRGLSYSHLPSIPLIDISAVAQRNSSGGISTTQNPASGATPATNMFSNANSLH